MKYEIVLAGVGGQGLIATGEIIGQAAAIYDGKHATLTSSYGSESRGTFAKSDVIVSDEEISYPNVVKPDIILCLAQVAYDNYTDKMAEDTLVFYDSDSVTPKCGAKGRHYGYPFRQMSIALNNMAVANTIALGAIISRVPFIRREAILAAIASRFEGRQKIIDLNTEALDQGIALT
jgi:2-oxoglutarate ferredoxin oxidoreductase subunit gamma